MKPPQPEYKLTKSARGADDALRLTGRYALFKSQTASTGRAVVRIPIDAIRSNPDQPRRRLSEASVRQLADSIRRHGQLTPVLVRACEGGWALIAGQRRILALKLLGRGSVDAVVLSADECDGALIALVENVQREQLHFLDEAEACRRILDRHPITQERLAASLSMSPSALANRLRLLKLNSEVREEIRRLGLSERHARALLRLSDAALQLELARRCAEERMSVKQLEARVSRLLKPGPAKPAVSPVVRDNRIIINAVMDTVRELTHIGIHVKSRVEACDDHIDVVVTIPVNEQVSH